VLRFSDVIAELAETTRLASDPTTASDLKAATHRLTELMLGLRGQFLRDLGLPADRRTPIDPTRR